MPAPRRGVDRSLPPGQPVHLAGRGTTLVREVPGPPGAPVLLLLHGLGATAAVNWFACFGPLGAEFRVIALDQRGHGRGIRPGRRGFRLEECADDVVALADALELDQIIPVGYSMGGPIAQLVWRRHPDRVRALVLCATSRNFRGTPHPDAASLALGAGATAAAAALRLVPPHIRRQFVRARVAQRVTDPDLQSWVISELSEHDPSALLEATRELRRFSSASWIGALDVPTAVVITDRDTVVSPTRQHKLAASIPRARVFDVDGDHTVCATHPRLFVPALVAACRWATKTASKQDRPLPGLTGA